MLKAFYWLSYNDEKVASSLHSIQDYRVQKPQRINDQNG